MSPFLLSKSTITAFIVHDFVRVFSDKHYHITWQMQHKCNINNLNLQQNLALDDKNANGRIIWRNDRKEILLGKIDNSTAELNEILLDPAIIKGEKKK